MSPYSPYPVPRGLPAGQLTPGILNGSSAQGIQRLHDTPPEERMRNARRAVKRLRHETRYQLAPMWCLGYELTGDKHANWLPCLWACSHVRLIES